MIESIEASAACPPAPSYVAQVAVGRRRSSTHGDLYWCATSSRRARVFSGTGAAAEGLRSFSVRPVASRRAPRAAASRPELIDEHCADAARTSSTAISGGASAGSCRRRWRHSARFRHAAAHAASRIGASSAVAARPRPRRRLNLMRFFADESCGQCTAMPRRHREGRGLLEQETGPAAARRAVAGDGRCVDLRPGSGGANPLPA